VSVTPLERLAGFVAGVREDALPEAVVRSVRERLLDTIGLCLAAAPLDTSAAARRVALEWGGPPQATVVGFGDRLPAAGAAFVNGTLAHSLDFDDTHLPSVLHPSASIVPGVLAAAESVGADTGAAVAAAAAGYEVCVRAGMAAYDRALGNSVFFERGWHATSICGTLGVAAAAAKLFGLDADGIGHAIAIAASMGSGILEGNRSGGSVKRIHCGWAAHAGIAAAQSARAGLTGPRSVLEGRFGFYQAFCGGAFDERELLDGLGDAWCVPGIFYKPYPANHFTHAAIDAALRLRPRVQLEEIAAVDVGVATPTLRTISEPREKKVAPGTGYEAQFSGPFAVAAALIGGGGLGLDLDDFSDANARDARYRALAAKVTLRADPACDAVFPNQFPAIVRIRSASGAVLEERVMANRGSPENPLSIAELRVKFLGNAVRVMSRDGALALAERVLDPRVRPASELAAATAAESLQGESAVRS
jgi:2-methylcitrate dehydratase PrpD